MNVMIDGCGLDGAGARGGSDARDKSVGKYIGIKMTTLSI